MEGHREISSRLDEVMDMVGASESMRSIHRRAATTMEILDTIHLDPKISYQCGSSYEGTVTPDTCSDIDVINCDTVPSIVIHRLMAGSGLRLLMFRDDWTKPGYVKLQGLQDGLPLTDKNFRADERWGFDRRGNACINHFPGHNKHGPASMYIDEDGKHIIDHVRALKCDGIPPFAAKWIRRMRSHGWPSEQMLEQMRVMGCIVVGTGFYNSPEKNFEWRVSFSLQERLLMKSLNIYQHKVYILLKLIKKDILENEFHEESLSSYHCKTCVFYVSEFTQAHEWTRDNLIECLRKCLGLLLKWLKDRFCPNYFMEEQNLFEKEGFERLVNPLQRLIEKIIESGYQFLYMLKSDHVGEILSSRDFRLYRLMSDVNVNEYIFAIRSRVIHVITLNYACTMRDSSRQHDALSFIIAELETFQSKDRVSGHTPDETKAALRHIIPWLHFQIGMEFACRAVMSSTRSEGKELMKKVDFHFRQARNTDFANVRLAQASILFQFGKFKECFHLLQELEAAWSFRVNNDCICQGGTSDVPNARTLHEYYPPMRDLSVTKLFRDYFAACVTFLPSQSELIPSPLKYEMFRSLGTPPGSRNELYDDWFDWAVVDAKVYLHFMQYLVCSRLDREPHKQIAIDNLVSLIEHYPYHNIYHKETAYNLLGWIYIQEHCTIDAVRCFLHSWQIRPHHNAAKFHMLNEYRSSVENDL